MKKLVAAIAALGLVPVPSFAQDGNAQVYRPSGGWTADFGDDYCRLARTFSNGSNELSLALERVQPTSFAQVILVGNGIRLYRGADMIGYKFSPSGEERTVALLRSETADGQQLLILPGVNFSQSAVGPGITGSAPIVQRREIVSFGAPISSAPGDRSAPDSTAADNVPPPGTPTYDAVTEQDFAGKVEGLMLTGGLLEPVQFETGSLRNVITILQDCTYDLLTYWEVDGQKHRTLSRTVVAEAGTTLPQGTIPFGDFGKLSGGANQVRLMIDTSGKPVSCNLLTPSLSDLTNGKICKHLMDNAKFKPALDAEGAPMDSYWIMSPLFMLGAPGGR